MHVRLPVELAERLDLLCRARDVNQNEMVEDILTEGVARALASVRERLGETAWEALTSGAGKRSGPAD